MMSVGDDVRVYCGACVLAVYTEIICVDLTDDGNLDGYTVDITYVWHENDAPVQWPVGTITPITSFNSLGQSVVNGLIIPVVPILPPGVNLEKLLRKFQKRADLGVPDDPVGSGTLTGSLNPPSSPEARRMPRHFQVPNVVVYFGVPV